MKTSPLAVLLSTAAVTNAQVVLDPTTRTFVCPTPAGAPPLSYCAGDSLKTNIIIRCIGLRGQPGNCNDNLAGVPPVGVKLFAPCYQSSAIAGDAACSFDGIVYSERGEPFPIPFNTTGTTSSVGAAATGNISTSLPQTQPGTKSSIQSATLNSTTLSAISNSASPLATDSISTTSGSSNITTIFIEYITREYPVGYTTTIAGVTVAIPASQTIVTPFTVTKAAYHSLGTSTPAITSAPVTITISEILAPSVVSAVSASLSVDLDIHKGPGSAVQQSSPDLIHLFTPVSVWPNDQPHKSYHPQGTPVLTSLPVEEAVPRSPLGIGAIYKYENYAQARHRLQVRAAGLKPNSTVLGSTAAGTGTPVNTSPPIQPVSAASSSSSSSSAKQIYALGLAFGIVLSIVVLI